MHSFAVLLVLLLAQGPNPQALAQQTDTAEPGLLEAQEEVRGVELGPNYPNPFKDETRIHLELGSDLFEDGRPVIVTARIFNVLRQVVAIPTVLDHPSAAGQPALEVRFDQPGRYTLWDTTMAAQPNCKISLHIFGPLAARSRLHGRRGRPHRWPSAKPKSRLSRQTKETTLRHPEALGAS